MLATLRISGLPRMGDNMSDSGQRLASFDVDFYLNSHSNALRLKQQLPEDALDGIVLEVLNRVRSHRFAHLTTVDTPSRLKIERLCYALISEDPAEGARFITDAQEEGASLEAIYLNYLAEASRMLGEWWDDDHVSFAEVMIGTSRVYSIIRSLSHLFIPDHLVDAKSAVFASVPEETHTLGIRMAADLFNKQGWDIRLLIGKSHEQLLDEVSEQPGRIIGLSAGGRHAAAPLTRLIMALRLNTPGAAIFLSGQITRAAPDLVELMDLDGVATDVETARKLMDRLWDQSQAGA